MRYHGESCCKFCGERLGFGKDEGGRPMLACTSCGTSADYALDLPEVRPSKVTLHRLVTGSFGMIWDMIVDGFHAWWHSKWDDDYYDSYYD